MHLRHTDPSYGDSLDAMQHWPEVETALAARLTPAGCSEVISPFAPRGLVFLPVTPNPLRPRLAVFRQRLATTGWC